MLGDAAAPSYGAAGLTKWHDQLTAVCGDISVEIPETGFDPQIATRWVGGIKMIRFSHNAVRSERTDRHLDDHARKHVILTLQRAGGCHYSSRRSDASVGPGDLAFVDMRSPFACRYQERIDAFCIYVPLSAMSARGVRIQDPGARTIPGKSGLGAVAQSLAISIFREADALSGANADGARDALLDLCSALYSDGQTAPATSAATLRHRVLDFIEAHLADPELSPAMIAAAHRTSVRHLHRVFADTDRSVSTLIRDRRLDRCRRDLMDISCQELTISEIAFRWGFNDSAHFSRAFRAAYAMSPRDARNSAGATAS